MFVRIVLTAKIGKDYNVRELGAIVDPNGRMQFELPKDMDTTKTYTMIFEPQEVWQQLIPEAITEGSKSNEQEEAPTQDQSEGAGRVSRT